MNLVYDEIEKDTTDIGGSYRPSSEEIPLGSFSLGLVSRPGSTMVDPIIAQFSAI